MTLKDYYKGLPTREHLTPRQRLIRKITEEVGCSISSAKNYCTGVTVPNKAVKEKIAEVIGIPVAELFCDETN